MTGGDEVSRPGAKVVGLGSGWGIEVVRDYRGSHHRLLRRVRARLEAELAPPDHGLITNAPESIGIDHPQPGRLAIGNYL
jgi:hypothetical protein